MTRFARAKGSKSSNERQPEEATSWSEMKKSLIPKQKDDGFLNNFKAELAKNDTQKPTEWASLGDDFFTESVSILKKHMAKDRKKVKGGEENVKTSKKEKKVVVSKESTTKNSTNKKKKKKIDKSISDTSTIQTEESISQDNTAGKKKKKKTKQNNSVVVPEKVATEATEKKKKNKKRNISEVDAEDVTPNKKRKSENGNEQPKKKDKNFNNQKRKDKFRNKSFDQNNSVVDELIINGEKIPIVKFQGFHVTQEDAERLKNLRNEMKKNKISKQKMEAAIKLERRRAEKALSRLKKSVCFHCRERGHLLSNCPQLAEKETTGTGICYKCGSGEHSAGDCKVVRGTGYQFAECFICKEQGHIARQCPDNPRGLYPDGGACKVCGDVTHLRKDCPEVLSQKAEEAVTVGLRNDRNLECLDEEIINKEKQQSFKKKKGATVKF